MLLVGRRVIPWLMHRTAQTGSREIERRRQSVVACADDDSVVA